MMNLREIHYFDGGWMELIRGHIHFHSLVLAMFNFQVLLSES